MGFCVVYESPLKNRKLSNKLWLLTVNDISNDSEDLPQELRGGFLPSNLDDMKGLWIELLQLSMKLEDVRLLQYRPGCFCELSRPESCNAKVS